MNITIDTTPIPNLLINQILDVFRRLNTEPIPDHDVCLVKHTFEEYLSQLEKSTADEAVNET